MPVFTLIISIMTRDAPSFRTLRAFVVWFITTWSFVKKARIQEFYIRHFSGGHLLLYVFTWIMITSLLICPLTSESKTILRLSAAI